MFNCITDRSQSFASLSLVQHLQIGDHVGLALRVLSVEEKVTYEKGEVYLTVHGLDIEGATVTYLRLWRFDASDVFVNKVYIIRGLKVVPAKQWDDTLGKFVPRLESHQELECTARVAIEDVSHVNEITSL